MAHANHYVHYAEYSEDINMPYIDNKLRTELTARFPENAGELNYIITKFCKVMLRSKGESYATYNELIGALECAKLELYRRKTALYEDKKAIENGDVW